jgi:serine/threonine protein kinase/capsular polysaccharide biosynthesis protein
MGVDTLKLDHAMPAGNPCPHCGTPLPTGALAGLCPACLLQQGAAADTATQPPTPAFVAPTIEEMARLFPQLEILGWLGRGGMGAVYKARQPALDRLVALKILPEAAGADAGFAERFTREARALARLTHPNIVGVFEFGQVRASGAADPAAVVPATGPVAVGGTGVGDPAAGAAAGTVAGGTPAPLLLPALHYFLMEFVDGVNLRQLQRLGRLGPREALQIVPQICDALQYAHDEGVVHRDIKPENVLVDRKGRVKVVDFGLAKLVGGNDPLAPSRSPSDGERVAKPGEGLALTGAHVMGTPNYMAPEQVDHPQDVDHRADIYALGVVFYEMLTGELPRGQFPPPSRKVRIDVRLDEVVLHALEREPQRRYQQAGEVKTAVENITADTAKSAVRSLKSEAPAHLGVLARRRQRQLWYGFIVSGLGLPIGLALRQPVVWGLALAGMVIAALKLGLLARHRNGGGDAAQAAVAPPRPLRGWERNWQALPLWQRRLALVGLGIAATALFACFFWPHREVVNAGEQVTDTWSFGLGHPWLKEVKTFGPNPQNWQKLNAATPAFAAGIASLLLLLGLMALANAERGTREFLLEVVTWPDGKRRLLWGRLVLVVPFFLLLAANLGALVCALMSAILGSGPPLLLLSFVLPSFVLVPVLRLLAVSYLRYSGPAAAGDGSPLSESSRSGPSAPPPRRTSPFVAALITAVVVWVFVMFAATVVTFLLPESYESTARIKIEREQDLSAPGATTPYYDPYFIQTEFEVLQSQLVLKRVIAALDLNTVWGRKYAGGQPLTDAESLPILRRCLELRPVRNTSLIAIRVFQDRPDEAARIANAIAEAYRAFRQEHHAQLTELGARKLREVVDEQQRKVSEAQEELERLRPASKTDGAVRSYEERKRELDGLIKFRNELALKLLEEETDAKLPLSSLVEIVDRATPALRPSRPNKPLNLFLGAVGGAVAGFLSGSLVLVVGLLRRPRTPPGPPPALKPDRFWRRFVVVVALVLLALVLLPVGAVVLTIAFSAVSRARHAPALPQPVPVQQVEAATNLTFGPAIERPALTTNIMPATAAVPQVAIEGLWVDSPVPAQADPFVPASAEPEFRTIKPGRSTFQFRYGVANSNAADGVHFRYRLEGLDRDWIEAGTTRIARYCNLPPGTYRFRVIARNSAGVWNETGATQVFRVLPQFWQTWWFFLASALLGVAAVGCFATFLARRRTTRHSLEVA